MSNLISSLAPHDLDRVLGGARIAHDTGDPLLRSLSSLSNTLRDIGNVSRRTGFSTTQVLMLGLLLSQSRSVNVFVRRPFW